MKKRISVTDVAELSVAERIQFVEDIWDSIAAQPDRVELPQIVRAELDKRVAAYRKNPHGGSSWKMVKKRILTGR